MSYNKYFHQLGKEPTGVDRFSGKKIHAKSAIFTKKEKPKQTIQIPITPWPKGHDFSHSLPVPSFSTSYLLNLVGLY